MDNTQNEPQEPLARYLSVERGFPSGLIDYFVKSGVQWLPNATSCAHALSVPISEAPLTGVLIPYFDQEGHTLVDSRTRMPYVRVRCVSPGGSLPKYLAQRGTTNHLFIPPGAIELARQCGFILVVEGEFKALVLMFHGISAVAVAGVWNWKGSKGSHKVLKPDGSSTWEKDPGEPIADLNLIPWEELEVYIAFDSDASTNPDVRRARGALAKHLREDRGANVKLVEIPAEPGGDKNGPDDFILRYGTDAFQTVLDRARLSTGTREPDDQRAEMEQNALVAYSLDLTGSPYWLDEHGIMLQTSKGIRPIANRVIYPAAVGRDLATGQTCVELAWQNSRGELVRAWFPESVLKDSAKLRALDDAPVSLGRLNPLSDCLVDLLRALLPDRKGRLLSSRMGWVQDGMRPRFVLAGDPEVIMLKAHRPPNGNVAGWASGLAQFVAMGEEGYTGLVVAGASAASILVRLLGKRNPVIGLVNRTSSGKSSTFGFVLSIWCHPADLTIPADSTIKGIQDAGLRISDMPMLLEEMQRLYDTDPDKAESAFYYGANGQRRVTSSKTQEAVGGERRFGVCFFAAEHSVSRALQTGAQYRVIELDGPPLQNGAQAARLQAIANEHHGVIGPLLAQLVTALPSHEIVAQLEAMASQFQNRFPGLRGDDAYTVALVQTGLLMLAQVTGVDLPATAVADWLARRAEVKRAEAIDKAQAAFNALLDTVLGAFWADANQLVYNGHHVAWRNPDGGFDINPQAPMVKEALRPFGGDRHARVWAQRGLIERDRDGVHLAVKRWNVPQRVWRIPGEVVSGNVAGNAALPQGA